MGDQGWDIGARYFVKAESSNFEKQGVNGQESGSVMDGGKSKFGTGDGLDEGMVDRAFSFFNTFRDRNGGYFYREQMKQHCNSHNYYIEVYMRDLNMADEDLAHSLKELPGEVLECFEAAAFRLASQLVYSLRNSTEKRPEIQVTLVSDQNLHSIRDLKSTQVGKLVRITGIVIHASSVRSKLRRVVIQCKECGHRQYIQTKSGLLGKNLPTECPNSESYEGDHHHQQHKRGNSRNIIDVAEDEEEDIEKKCGKSTLQIIPDESECIDQQLLKLQEKPESVPNGEMPRHLQVSLESSMVGKVVPGQRICVVGIFELFNQYKISVKKKELTNNGGQSIGVRLPYLRVLGVNKADVDADSNSFDDLDIEMVFSSEEVALFREMGQQVDIADKIVRSIAPSIVGNEDIKKSIASLLFGGVRKRLSDGMTLRGDVNVLLLGDPGTAKSQLLKFVSTIAPIAVYTSGKGSSAAGLTASVVRDGGPASDFHLEAGAMVLADNGVVCIDEFDKMRENDRVAIHEAMEQQTISIAKAGITTVLNTRCSILAAANSTFGKWKDDSDKSSAENLQRNLDFQTTILSRFDMIYVIKDLQDSNLDKMVAHHVINSIHRGSSGSNTGAIAPGVLKKYIGYCRKYCAPRLSMDAVEKLASEYVRIRALSGGGRSSVPITVRQLEAMVRISESLAKMELRKDVEWRHVQEALRLFHVSTLQSATNGDVMGVEGLTRVADSDSINAIRDNILKRFPIGAKVMERKIIDEYVHKNYSILVVKKALWVLLKTGVLEHRQGKKVLYRAK